MQEILKTLDETKLPLQAGKCKIANQEIEWLDFQMTSQGISPVNSKVQGITEKLRLTNLKELRSFLVATNQFNKFIPDMRQSVFVFHSDFKERRRMELDRRTRKSVQRNE